LSCRVAEDFILEEYFGALDILVGDIDSTTFGLLFQNNPGSTFCDDDSFKFPVPSKIEIDYITTFYSY
jgi:hypothetical protein